MYGLTFQILLCRANVMFYRFIALWMIFTIMNYNQHPPRVDMTDSSVHGWSMKILLFKSGLWQIVLWKCGLWQILLWKAGFVTNFLSAVSQNEDFLPFRHSPEVHLFLVNQREVLQILNIASFNIKI